MDFKPPSLILWPLLLCSSRSLNSAIHEDVGISVSVMGLWSEGQVGHQFNRTSISGWSSIYSHSLTPNPCQLPFFLLDLHILLLWWWSHQHASCSTTLHFKLIPSLPTSVPYTCCPSQQNFYDNLSERVVSSSWPPPPISPAFPSVL